MAWKLVNPNITNDPSYLDPRLSDDESKISSNTTSLAEIMSQLINVKYPRNGLASATGDGITDDTTALKSIIAYAKTNNISEVYFPQGTYLIDGSANGAYYLYNGGLVIDFPLTITLHPNAVIKQKTTTNTGYNIFTISNGNNITIRGGSIVGDYGDTGAGTGTFAFGIYAKYASNITIENVNISKFRGDGIIFDVSSSTPTLTNSNIIIRGCTFDSNKRMGITVGRASNILIERNIITNNGSASPNAGIDLEGFGGATDTSENITIRNNYLSNNQQAEILVQSTMTNLKIIENKINPTTRAISINSNCTNAVSINIKNNYIYGMGTTLSGISLSMVSGNTINVTENYITGVSVADLNYGGAIKCEGTADNIRISKNTIVSSYMGFMHKTSLNRLSIIDNKFKDIANYAITNPTVNKLNKAIISNNHMENCLYGIFIRANNSEIVSNILKTITNTGIYLANVNNSIIKDNQIEDFDTGATGTEAAIRSISPSINNLISGNLITVTSGTPIAITVTGTTSGNPNIVTNNVARYATGVVTVDANSISSNNFTV